MNTFNLISKRYRWLVFFFLGLISHIMQAQYQVKGHYVDNAGNPVPFASVMLLNSSDSSLVKGNVTNEAGDYEIKIGLSGSYVVIIEHIGYVQVSSPTFSLGPNMPVKDLGTLTAVEKSQSLDDVVIKGEKPLFEQQIDRTVINLKNNMAAAGGNALDVLAMSPGVTVDKMNNALSLAGKQGVKVMINGKISKIPMDAIMQMLAGTNAANIEKIELITTPPARYDAEGDAGLINIVMKKQTDLGTNVNLTVFGGYGQKEKYGGSLNLNNRVSEDLNFYGDYSYDMNVVQNLWTVDRTVNTVDGPEVYDTDNLRNAYTRVHNGSVGVDYTINNKLTTGGRFSAFDSHWQMHANADIYQTGQTFSFIDMATFEINHIANMMGNAYLSYNINKGQQLTLDIDRISYDASNPTDYDQNYYDEENNLTGTEILQSRKETQIEYMVGKLDYSAQLNKQMTLEVGGKVALSKLENNIIVRTLEDEQYVVDPGLTSDADMIENIGAGYASATINATDHINLQIGLRYEYTHTNIDTKAEKDLVDRNFGNWFPSVFFKNKINKNNSWVLSYSRRISRPSFSQIAPFVIFVDPNNFWQGNISLLPAMTDALKAEYRFKSILFSAGYSHDKNSITMFQPRINENNQLVNSSENLDYVNYFHVNISVPFELTDWWEWQVNFAGNREETKASFLENPVDISVHYFSANWSSKIHLPKQFTFQISGFYQSKRLWGITKMHALGALNLAIEKKFENSEITLNLGDVFKTNNWQMSTFFPKENLNTRTKYVWDTRVVKLTYALSIGNNNLNIDRRSSGSKEEQERL